MGVVLPYFAKNDIAASPVLIDFNKPLTDLSTNRAFCILFCEKTLHNICIDRLLL
jgi:hypothetical protein